MYFFAYLGFYLGFFSPMLLFVIYAIAKARKNNAWKVFSIGAIIQAVVMVGGMIRRRCYR